MIAEMDQKDTVSFEGHVVDLNTDLDGGGVVDDDDDDSDDDNKTSNNNFETKIVTTESKRRNKTSMGISMGF